MFRKVTPPPARIPKPPAEALKDCTIPPLMSGNSEAVEMALIERGIAIKQCNARRRALIAGWPKQN